MAINLNVVDIELIQGEALVVQSEPSKAAKTKVLLPDRFTNDRDWIGFRNAIKNYLGSVRGVENVPLLYLIRTDGQESDIDRDPVRWLGPSKCVVCDLVFKIRTKSGHVIHTSAVEPVTPEERDTDAYKKLINDYDKAII